jgi:hypothetical protein
MQTQPSIVRRAGRAALTCLVMLPVVACGSHRAASGATPTRRPSLVPATSEPVSPSPSPVPSVSPTKPRAANGTNLATCVDATCEVEIKVGDIIRFGRQVHTSPRIDRLVVVSVDDDGANFLVPSGAIIGGGGTLILNHGIQITFLYADGQRAVIRIDPVRA